MSFCPNCGSQVAEGNKFCTNCGAKMEVAAAAPVAAPAAPAAPAQQPAQPVYQAPAQQPAQPVYQAPAQQPAQPVYQAPAQQPAQPVYQAPAQQPVQPAYQAPVSTPPAPPAPPAGGKEKKPLNKKTLMFGGIGVVVILVIAILIAALGGGGGDANDPNLGMYNCVSCTSMGLDLGADGEWIELKAKGKAELFLFDEEYSAKWSLDGDKFVLTQAGDEYEGSLKDGVLTIDFAGMLFTYHKEGAAPGTAVDPGKDDKNDKPAAASEVGYWTLLRTEGDDPSMVMDEETIKMLKEMGMEIYLILNEDGSGVFFVEEAEAITWGDGKLTAEGDSIDYTLDGEQLYFDIEGTKFIFVRGEGEGPGGAVAGPGTEPDDEPVDAPVEEGPYAWWDGEWYGWWIVQSGSGYYEEWEDYYWDAYARIDVDGETGWIDLWDEDTSADSPLASMEVYFTSGVSEHGTMRAESGYFMDYEIQHADWSADPGAMGFDIDELIWIDFKYIDPTNEDDYMNVYIFLRPWGMKWDDLDGVTGDNWPYDDMMPGYYKDWYLPLIKAGESLPDSFADGKALLGGGTGTATTSGDAIASGVWEDCIVEVVGAEAFKDIEGEDAIRIYYYFTNTSDDIEYASGLVDFNVTQDGYDAEYAVAAWDEEAPEYGNDHLYVRPGVRILCCEEFFMKATGGDVVVEVYNWWGDDDESFTVSFDPKNLPGRPAEYVIEPITDPTWALDYSDSGSTGEYDVYIDWAEIIETWDGEGMRLYIEFTNNSDEAISPFVAVSLYAFQDGVQMPTCFQLDSTDSDDLYYADVAPGETVTFSVCYELRNNNPVEIQVNDFWSDVIAAAMFTIS